MSIRTIPKQTSWVVRLNFGDESIALLRWLYEQRQQISASVTCVYITTGWESSSWIKHVQKSFQLIESYHFKSVLLNPLVTYDEMIAGRSAFPEVNHQWCASLLKGIPFLNWLDEIDERNETLILIPKRHKACRSFESLPEYISSCEYHGQRAVWHPILNVTNHERDNLIYRAGFKVYHKRSEECFPCVLHSQEDIESSSTQDKQRLHQLEQLMGCRFPARVKSENAHQYPGCGSYFGCGL